LEETITYELIRKVQREEQKQPKLTRLPDNFFESVTNYLQQKRQIAAKDERKLALEVKNAERLVEDIFNRRERKIVNFCLLSARTGVPPENMTEEEKAFFEQVEKLVKDRRERVLGQVMRPEDVTSMVVFREDTSAFVGADGKTYGPFRKGDVAKLPEENVKFLIEKKIVEEFKVSK
jgi:DNA replication initiation complex subunit (GINS family)